jgi:asparagine synthase (glutamine-hydrolysing)
VVCPEKIFHALDETKRMVSVQSLPQLEDCVAFYLICEQIRNETKEGGKLLLSANGPDELFCGYDRFRRIVDSAGYEATQREIIRSLRAADILRENVQIIARSFELKIVEPFFEEEFVNFCIKIPIELKILKGNDMLRKRIWRHYAQYLGISKQVAEKPKKAMQYSMGIHKILSPLIKKERSIIRP